MWTLISGKQGSNEDIVWQVTNQISYKSINDRVTEKLDSEDGIVIAILFPDTPFSQFSAGQRAASLLKNTRLPQPTDWLLITDNTWILDFDKLKSAFGNLQNLDWLGGIYIDDPNYQVFSEPISVYARREHFAAELSINITPEMIANGVEPATSFSQIPDLARWDILKPLASGGQAQTFLVKDKQLVESRDQIRENVINSLHNLAHASERRKKKGADELVGLIQSLFSEETKQALGVLKLLHETSAARESDPDIARQRMQSEIRAMVDNVHPNLLKILDHDLEQLWYVSEYHPNGTLEDLQARFAGNVPAVFRAIRPIVDSVAQLHKQNIVHRDIKPANIFVSEKEELILGDFGLVIHADDQSVRVTRTLTNVGSWDWMPDWAQGYRTEIDPTFDVFGLGKVIWWMISGLPIQRLRSWYHDDEEHQDINVLNLFPNAPCIEMANPLLARCVVQRKRDCLLNAEDLLNELDRFLRIIERRGNLMKSTIPRPCKVCGLGTYKIIKEENMLSSVGVDKVGSLKTRADRCNYCGNVQVFVTEDPDITPGFFLPN